MKDVRRESLGQGQFLGRSPGLRPIAKPQVQVTLSAELLNHLRTESRLRQVPLRWLVVGLVCDTMKTDGEVRSVSDKRVCGSRA